MKKNIIKIIITCLMMLISMFFVVIGLFMSYVGDISSEFVVVLLAVLLFIVFIIRLSGKFEKPKLKKILEILIWILFSFFIIFVADLFMQKQFVPTEKELAEFYNEVKEELNIVFGDDNWEIINYRKSFDKVLKVKYNTYEENSKEKFEIIRFYDEFSAVDYLIDKVNDELPTRIYLRFEEYPSSEILKNNSISVHSLSLEKFLRLESAYIEYDADFYDLDSVKKVVGENVKLLPQ